MYGGNMFGDSFSVTEVDETASVTEMMGASSASNIGRSLRISPARSLVVLWFVVLAAYWFLGYVFKSAR
jgi:hypothetical protein